MDKNKMIELLIEHGIATEKEINLVVDIAGGTTETIEAILYSRTGYESFDQIDWANPDASW